MTRLVTFAYLSRARSSDLDAAALDAILVASQRHNVINDITGAVVFGDGRFVQVLEGPEPAVVATLERIRRDARHHDLQIVGPDPLSRRIFPDWSMARIAIEPQLEPAWRRLISAWPSEGAKAALILSAALEAEG